MPPGSQGVCPQGPRLAEEQPSQWPLHFCLFLFLNVIYSCEFSASLLQSSMTHDPIEIILIC